MPYKRRKFDAEFREGPVRLVRETGKPIACDLGLNGASWETGVCHERGSESSGPLFDCGGGQHHPASEAVQRW